MKRIYSKLLTCFRWLKCVTSSAANRRSVMPVLLLACIALLWVAFAATAQAQTLLSETTWGGSGSDVAEGVATAADGHLVCRRHYRQFHHGSIR